MASRAYFNQTNESMFAIQGLLTLIFVVKCASLAFKVYNFLSVHEEVQYRRRLTNRIMGWMEPLVTNLLPRATPGGCPCDPPASDSPPFTACASGSNSNCNAETHGASAREAYAQTESTSGPDVTTPSSAPTETAPLSTESTTRLRRVPPTPPPMPPKATM